MTQLIENLQLVDLCQNADGLMLIIRERITPEVVAIRPVCNSATIHCMAKCCADCHRGRYWMDDKVIVIHYYNPNNPLNFSVKYCRMKGDILPKTTDLLQTQYCCGHRGFDLDPIPDKYRDHIVMDMRYPPDIHHSYSLFDLSHVDHPLWRHFNWTRYHSSHKNPSPDYILAQFAQKICE
jgi:hypothetical protein